MCRFQKEINSKIQEKKALEIPAEIPAVSCNSESAEDHESDPGPTMCTLEEAPEQSEGSPEEDLRHSDEEEQCHCGGHSVGTA